VIKLDVRKILQSQLRMPMRDLFAVANLIVYIVIMWHCVIWSGLIWCCECVTWSCIDSDTGNVTILLT